MAKHSFLNNLISFEDKRPTKKDGDFKVKHADGREAMAYIDENWQRTALMVQGTDGAFWRPFTDRPTHWKINNSLT